MPRSVQITKEKILTAALDVLIRDGYLAVNIKSIAKELKCSTQPIAWQFGNIILWNNISACSLVTSRY